MSRAVGGSMEKILVSRRSLRVLYSCSGMLNNLYEHHNRYLYLYSHPRKRWQALEDIFGEVFRREVAVLQECTRLNLDVANRA